MRERCRVCYTPQWEGTIRQYALKFIHKNKWRVDRVHEVEDLEQDALLIFIKIRDKYPRVIEERHFMALFKRALANNFHDRALYMKRKRVLHQDTDQDVSELFTGQIGDLSNWGHVNVLLAEAPEELKVALRIITETPEVLEPIRRSKIRENLNAKLRRVLNAPSNFDFVGGLRALLS